MMVHPLDSEIPVPLAAHEFERAHVQAVKAATAGLQDSGMREIRLTGPGVPLLAEAAVSSATPFLRAPLFGRISAALLLHPPGGETGELCPTCRVEVPCETAQVLQ